MKVLRIAAISVAGSAAGVLAAVLSTHGPSFPYVLSAVLIPSALVVPLITGFAIVARAATYLGRAPSAPVG